MRMHLSALVALLATALLTTAASPVPTYTTRQQTEGIILPYSELSPRKTLVTPEQGRAALQTAYTYRNVPYVWGGESMKGIDCSGLVIASYRAAIPGMLLQSWDSPAAPDAAAIDLYYYGTLPVTPSELRAGDLVFMRVGSSKPKVTHVVMVRAVDGDSISFINATTRFGKVTEETWSMVGTDWKQRYVGCGRLLYIPSI